MKTLPPRLLSLLLALAFGCGPPGGGPDGDGDGDGDGTTCDASGGGAWPAESASFECQVLTLVNARRAEGGDCRSRGTFAASSPLTMDPQLRTAARRHSEDMGERGYFSHDSTGGPYGDNLGQRVASAGFTGWTSLGENIAGGFNTPDGVMSIWMGSDGHCANILNPNYNLLGAGYANVSGSPMTHYWTQVFARRL